MISYKIPIYWEVAENEKSKVMEATITCCHILENGEPILYVSHDEDDGMWQFLCGKAHETDEAKLVSLKSVFDLDNSVGILKDMPCGYYAERKAQDDEWSVRKR